MAVRKRTWKTAEGKEHEAWIVDYRAMTKEGKVKRYTETFECDARHAEVNVNIRKGIHVAPTDSITIREAADLWLQACARKELERSTVESYKSEAEHLLPLVGHVKLTHFSMPAVRKLEDALSADHSPVMVKRCLKTLGCIFANAQDEGLVVVNPVRERTRKRNGKSDVKRSSRDKGKLKVGVHIPSTAEMKAIINAATSLRWRVFLMTAAFTGLRAGELRGLRWENVHLDKSELNVMERADKYRQIGNPKSRDSSRTVPLVRVLVAALKEWKDRPEDNGLARLRGPNELVFPAERASVLCLQTICESGYHPAVVRAGLVTKDGKPKYTGLHTLRHFYASWCLAPKERGGCGLDYKTVQEQMGHSKISMTLDTYGHLFPVGAEVMNEAADKLLGS